MYNKESSFSNDGFPTSALINEELPDRADAYYGKVDGIDSTDYENILWRKRQLLGKRLKRMGRFPVGGTFTTGPPPTGRRG